MLRVAIVGCGKVADQHIYAIQRISDCRIVAAVDRELLMARQLAERFNVPECFFDLNEMLHGCEPDVVHITTPPQSHFSLARQCLEFGSHVYVEKPFAVTANETEELIQFADSRGLRMTVGHNYQFTLEMLEMRRLVKQGFLGGKPVHLESYWSYDLSDLSYVGPVLGNREHLSLQLIKVHAFRNWESRTFWTSCGWYFETPAAQPRSSVSRLESKLPINCAFTVRLILWSPISLPEVLLEKGASLTKAILRTLSLRSMKLANILETQG